MKVFTLFLIIIGFKSLLFGQKNEIIDVEQFIPQGYNNYLSKSHDIDLDGYKDYLIISEPEFTEQAKQPPFQENNRLFFIWKYNKNRKKYEIWELNYKFLLGHNSNCPLGEIILDVKDNYFTVRHQYCHGQFFRTDYTTFKFDKKLNKIVLHKVGLVFVDRYDTEKNIPEIIYSQKEFDIISFSNYESLENLNIYPSYPKP